MNYQKTLLLIKPLTVNRGDSIFVLGDILRSINAKISDIHETRICETSWKALSTDTLSHPSTIDFYKERKQNPHHKSIVCVLEINDESRDIYKELDKLFGDPYDRKLWTSDNLRKKYSVLQHTDIDNVVHITHPLRFSYEKAIVSQRVIRCS